MADLTSQDRLQPALLDRLMDDEPQSRVESRDRRVISMRKLRECVLRDLSWLLNTGNLAQVEELDDFPHAVNSVLNYGVRDLAGLTVSSADPRDLEKRIRQAILDFEPRILRRTLKVRAVTPEDALHHNAIAFEIEGELWGQPMPVRLYLKSEVDLEDGTIQVIDRTEAGPA
jgi:type VI secretion system protein ImpF